ncbi:F-box protein [Quillaja saponaria]|uniref:F-box protein n=1 Tax=Quillaja saponaria TaxID=32244 RepID=A0AAD7LD12_QUISA|nr:F-box protein [Quillaja saponaria]
MEMDMTLVLPEDCISKIISFTSPQDACRLSLVSPIFKAAADSDAVWEKFLPSDCEDIISQSSSSSSSILDSLSKKNLYFHLCDHPVLISNDTMSFFIDKKSGKKCYMVGAKGLSIEWGDTPSYWKWTSLPDSRFPQVAELIYVWWLEIKGNMETKLLSSHTIYEVFLVFKFAEFKSGFGDRPVELSVNSAGREAMEVKRVMLDPPADVPQLSKQRGDGWLEIEMGEYFNEHGDDGSLVCKLWEFDGYVVMGGLVVEGIEFRPKVSG